MKNREVALEFVRCFCAADVDGLASLLAEDLEFHGPFSQFSSRDAYLESLKSDPLEKSGYGVLIVTESQERVSIFWQYEKRDGAMTIAQLFRFQNEKISEILLVFDGRGIS